MKLNFTFRHMQSLPELEAHVEDKILRLKKYDIKMSWANIVISKQRHRITAELKLVGKDACMIAKASSDAEYEALDLALQKLERQMAKHKEIVQKHKHRERTKQYALDHFTNEALEVDYNFTAKRSRRKMAA